ncbi:MAG: GNAT family N-acetyltransferase [Pseudomonadota bacterium]
MSTIELRPATLSDLETIQAIAKEAYTLYVPRIGREPAPMRADFSSAIHKQHVTVATRDVHVLGFVVFFERDAHMHLENVAVAPDAHGAGVGSALVNHVENVAQAQRLGSVELYTNEKMIENVPWYLARGYEEVGRWEEDGFNRIFFRKAI